MIKKLFWLLLVVPAFADWDEIRSPHFTVLTDNGIASGREVAYYFEQINHVFTNLFPGIETEPNRDMVIIALGGNNTINAFIEEVGIGKTLNLAGVFIPGRYRHCIVVSVEDMQRGRQTILHEYTHMIVNGNFTLPLWMDEGLACFIMPMEFHSSKVNIGKVSDKAYRLKESAMITLEELAQVDHSSPMYNENDLASVFYAQAWLLTHYALMSEEGRNQKLFNQLLQLTNRGVPSLDAMRQVFGDLPALEQKLKTYYRKNRFPFYSIKTELKLPREKYPTSKLSPEQVLSYKLVIKSQQTGDKFDTGMVKQLEAHVDKPGVALNLGLILAHAGKQLEAVKVLKRNKDTLENDWLAPYLLSLEPNLRPLMKRQHLEQTLAKKPNFAPAAYDLAWMLKDKDPETALTFASQAVKADPQYIHYRVLKGTLLLRLKRFEESQALAAETRTFADELSKQIIEEEWTDQFNRPEGSTNSTAILTYSPNLRTIKTVLRDDRGYRRNKLYQTPLLQAVWSQSTLEELAPILPKGKDDRSLYGESALHLAAEFGHQDLTDQCLALGYDLNAVDAGQWSPLLIALAEDNAELAQKLIEAGANVDTTNALGQTGLMWACYHGRTDLVKKLLAKTQNRHAQDKNGHTAFDYLEKDKDKELQSLLREFKVTASKTGALSDSARRELFRARALDMHRAYDEKAGTKSESVADGNLQESRLFSSSNKELNDLYRKATDATLDNEHEKSLRLLEKIIAADEKYEPAHDLLVHVLCVMGKSKEALAAVDRYAKIAGNRQNLGERYFQVAKLVALGDLTGENGRSVEICLKKAWILTGGKEPMIQYYLGDLYFQFGADAQALTAYKAYLASGDTSNWRAIAEDNVRTLEAALAK